MGATIHSKSVRWIIVLLSVWVLSRLDAAEPAIGVLTLHGMGSHEEGSDYGARLRKNLQEKAGGKVKVVMKNVYYHGQSRDRQAKLWKEFDGLEDRDSGSLDQMIIRRLMLVSLSDALAYASHGMDQLL
jgi:hypothetical protein